MRDALGGVMISIARPRLPIDTGSAQHLREPGPDGKTALQAPHGV